MTRLQLNKSSLAKEAKDLATYKRYLPSLDLKRQQLMAERAKVVETKQKFKQQLQNIRQGVKTHLPMLSNSEIKLDNLVVLNDIQKGQENVVGVLLPAITSIDIEIKDYSLLSKPHWVDNYVLLLSEAMEVKIHIALQLEREGKLNDAIRTITQRVNLFEKVLIPQAKHNIKRIKIYLSDEQMTSVVRSKIAKRKRIQGEVL